MYDNAQAQKTFRSFKTRLSRALNKKDWQAVLVEARRFRDYYRTSDEPWPDDWHRWRIAADDAFGNLRRAGISAERVDF